MTASKAGKRAPAVATTAVEAQVASFIAKFDPPTAHRIRECRAALRNLFPTATEVGLSFYSGATLPDPDHLLLGSGKQNRFIRLAAVEVLASAPVRALIAAAAAQARTPFVRPAAATR